MNGSPEGSESSPERPISELCMNLESQFMNVQDLSKAEGMRVYARVRPMLDSELQAGYKECIGIIDEKTIRAVVPSSSAKYKSSSHLSQDVIEDFTFTAAYGPETGQFVFFEDCMMNTMQNFIEGQNSLIFSYGTTGSGKTFTLQGDTDNPGIIPLSLHLFFASIEHQLLDRIIVKPDKFADVIVLNDNEVKRELEVKEQLLSGCDQEEWNYKNSSSSKSLASILCNTFSQNFEADGLETTLCPQEMAQAQAAALMKELSKKSVDQQTGYCSVWVSFVEIYNEYIYDLLQPNVNQRSKLTLGEDKNGDVYVKGLREVCVFDSHEALKLLHFGQRNLNIASTKLNYKSSRSHCIFTVKVIRIPDPENAVYAKINRLSFCDLAGSERAAKSQTTGMRLKEAGCINTSLLVLGRCIEQLRLKPSLRDKKLIPFRESKLTRLFSGFFTGRGKAVMVINASPSELTFDETLHVLRFSAIAKELIINDSYIATASSTLQSITNMWANTKVNSSVSSDRSISFEDSMEDAIQEKDELIEKLLDLAESLRNNLEREKKEKAELELKIRQDVCQEYSEYSDELLENQRQNFAEEREAIRDIYQKRISAMEKMYENIIKDYKMQLEESDSSEDEAFEIVQSQKVKETGEASEQDVTDERVKNSGFDCENLDLSKVTEESKKTKEELTKTVDYSLSLEMELEAVRKELEDIKLQLQVAMKENVVMKKELDAYKIDCYAYKTENNSLIMEKSALEQDIASLTKDLANVTDEKEAVYQNLIESEDKVANYNNEIQKLLSRINELVKVEEEFKNCEKLLEEASSKNEEVSKKLLSVSQELSEEREKKADLELLAASLEAKISELQLEEFDIIQKNNAVESLSNELNDVKVENANLKKKLEDLEKSEFQLNQTVCELEAEIEKLNEIHLEDEKKLSDAIKRHETEAKEAEEDLISMNKTIDDTLILNQEKEKKLVALETECVSLKKEMADALVKIEDLSGKLESVSKELEIRNQKYKEEYDVISKKLNESELTISQLKEELQNLITDINHKKIEIETLTTLNNQLEEKIKSQAGIEKNEPDSDNSELKKAIEELTEKIQNKESECLKHKNEVSSVQEASVILEEKLSSLSKEFELRKMAHKEEVDDLLKERSCSKAEITELHELIKQLEEKNSQLESEKLASKEELKSLSTNLDAVELIISKQREELENLSAESNFNKNEIEKLTELNKDLTDKINSQKSQIESEYRQEIESMKKELSEAQLLISKQKELENILTESNINKDEMEKITKLNKELTEKINDQNSQIDVILKLVEVLENCDLYAINKINQMDSHSAELKAEVEKLRDQIKTDNEDHKNVCVTLNKLIDVLQKCEVIASAKAKELHTSSIKHVEQIMDFEKCNKLKEKEIENLKNDYNVLQKQSMESESVLKKQLQENVTKAMNEKRQYATEIDSIKNKQAAVEKENKSLKEALNQLQNEKQQYMVEIDRIRQEIIEKENKSLKQPIKQVQEENVPVAKSDVIVNQNENNFRKSERRSKEVKKESKKQVQDENIVATNTEVQVSPNERIIKRSERRLKEEKKEKESVKQEEKKTRNTKKQQEKRKEVEKSETVMNNKKQKPKIYEETQENISSEPVQKGQRTGRRELRCMKNITSDMNVVQNNDLSSTKTRASKRKGQKESEEKSSEQALLKRIKMDVGNENISKPQNLAIKVLKANTAMNDIPFPSPRMTRGRRRLANIQTKVFEQSKASPRTMRS